MVFSSAFSDDEKLIVVQVMTVKKVRKEKLKKTGNKNGWEKRITTEKESEIGLHNIVCKTQKSIESFVSILSFCCMRVCMCMYVCVYVCDVCL